MQNMVVTAPESKIKLATCSWMPVQKRAAEIIQEGGWNLELGTTESMVDGQHD